MSRERCLCEGAHLCMRGSSARQIRFQELQPQGCVAKLQLLDFYKGTPSWSSRLWRRRRPRKNTRRIQRHLAP
eukprot:15447717-Alexandrium_andersonii.AAC.1